MPLTIIRNDITKMDVDVIVNAANIDLRAGGGVCGAIFAAAGAGKLQKACDRLAPVNTGDAVITKGFSLPAKYVIHAVGPVYKDGKSSEESQLRACYENALNLAKKFGCKSIAFPLISSGVYGYPKDEALAVATGTIGKWLMKADMDVSLVVFDKAAFALSGGLLGAVKAFIDENYVDERNVRYSSSITQAAFQVDSHCDTSAVRSFEPPSSYPMASPKASMAVPKTPKTPMTPMASHPTPSPMASSPANYSIPPKNLKKRKSDVVVRLDEPFTAALLRQIDAKGKTDVEIYKRANLDRKLFSKIRTGKNYMPSKRTAVALAVAMELSLPETRDLLERAGFALSRSVVFDVIIEYFISRKKYDIFEINNVLFEYDQQLLGG